MLGHAVMIINIKKGIGKLKSRAMKKKNEMLAEYYWMNYFSENYWD